MDVTVLEVPQWQGSGSRTAERLTEGARLLAGMVPGARRRVPIEIGDDLAANAARVREAIVDAGDGLLVTAGGDCGVEFGPISTMRERYGDRLVVLWFDAHGDLNTPESSPSGAYHGMVLRGLMGEGPKGLAAEDGLRAGQIVLAGVRDLDPAEETFVRESGIRHVRRADVAGLLEAVAEAVAATRIGATTGSGATTNDTATHSDTGDEDAGDQNTRDGEARDGQARDDHAGDRNALDGGAGGGAAGDGGVPGGGGTGGVRETVGGPVLYVHVDLDVLDPERFASVGCPTPEGFGPDELLSMVTALAERYDVVGLGIMEYEPGRVEDHDLLGPLVEGLVKACSRG
ncbi:arginase family protein [Nonomuraea sp. NN258]|uniref:arginase family protein n=1 Tax=Nonomuraea antri TaxID=2730852 RepID=UPI0015698E4C|nr:arginase family protein [Nonomuraea antri]NRQ40400.1 arginase family protein [Nonomuraea antri]